MNYLHNFKITAAVTSMAEEVEKIFGDVYIGTRDPLKEARLKLTVTIMHPNIYAGYKKSPMFVVVPNQTLDAVWLGKGFDEVRIGEASFSGNPPRRIVRGVYILKGKTAMYLCMSPRGFDISVNSNFGV